jgi:tripartite-type tricarboxylate transporter receptor subunit TctC
MKSGLLLACAAAALALACASHAQTYPAKPLRLISPYPPGGGTDATARILAQALAPRVGQQVIVESRGGASGRIGTELAAKAAPDGYTLVMGVSAPLVILPASGLKLAYDAARDFQPVSLISTSDYIVTVHPSLPARNVKELMALARARPGALTYASDGNLGGPHLAGELVKLLAKVNILHVPYKGNGPAAVAILTGEAQLMFGSGPAVVPHIEAGKLRALATTGSKRSIKDLPAMSEMLPGFEVSQWWGVLVPAAVSKDIVARLNAEIVAAVADPKVILALEKLGTQPLTTTPEGFAALIKTETAKYAKVIEAAKIVPE